MAQSESFPFLGETLLFLALAGLLIPLLQRLRINQVVGFLAAGLLLGPHGMPSWSSTLPWLASLPFPSPPEVEQLANLGVIFLMFLIGLGLPLGRVWELRTWVLRTGSAQIALSTIAIGLIAYTLGQPTSAAMVLGLVLSLSSTAVVIQLLTQRHLLETPLGQAVFSVLMMQDLVVLPTLVLIDLLAQPQPTPWGALLWIGLKSVFAVALILVVGKPLMAPLFRAMTRHRQPEVFVALTLLAALGVGGLTAVAGFSMTLGAFLAGMLLAETEFRHEIEVTIEPFKGLLMGLFFLSVGMGFDLRELLREPLWLSLGALGLLLVKALIAGPLLFVGGLPRGAAVAGGLLVAQGGEFAFVLLGQAGRGGLIEPATNQFMMTVVVLTLMMTPLCDRVGLVLSHWLDGQDRTSPPDRLSDHVLIAGCGRTGQRIARMLTQQGIHLLAIDHDAHRVAKLRAQGLAVVYGNAARPEILQRMALPRAGLLIVTLDEPRAALHTVIEARRMCPDLPIYARSHDEIHAQALKAAGATTVVSEMLESSLQVAAGVLRHCGIPETSVQTMVTTERQLSTESTDAMVKPPRPHRPGGARKG